MCLLLFGSMYENICYISTHMQTYDEGNSNKPIRLILVFTVPSSPPGVAFQERRDPLYNIISYTVHCIRLCTLHTCKRLVCFTSGSLGSLCTSDRFVAHIEYDDWCSANLIVTRYCIFYTCSHTFYPAFESQSKISFVRTSHDNDNVYNNSTSRV